MVKTSYYQCKGHEFDPLIRELRSLMPHVKVNKTKNKDKSDRC